MKQLQLLTVLGIAGTISVFAASPVRAEVVQVTRVQLNQIENGLEVILETPTGKSPQAFTTRSGQTWVADLIDTKLVLPNGKPFRQDRPIKGIRSVLITQQTANSVRVTVTGETQVPQAQVIQSDRGLVLSLTPATDTTADLPQRSTQPPASSPSEEPVEPEAEPTEQPAAEGEEEVEITVTATRTEEEPQDVPRSVTVINREQVEQQTRLSRDVGEILGKLVPGLSPPTQSSSSFGLPLPELESLPQELKAVMLSEPPEGLCQFIWAGLFICHHRYLADLLEAHHNYPERIFWQKVRQAILNYQSRFPNLQARFELFDLLAPSFTKLCLNRNRLLTYGYADDGDRPHAATFGFVSNALHLASVKFEKASESTRS